MKRTNYVPEGYTRLVLQAVTRLIDRAGISGPPIDVERLAALQGVVEITDLALGATDAQLTPTPGGYVIEVNAFASSQRRRFSIAHEVAHTFFNPKTRTYRRSREVITIRRDRPERVAEEMLCDDAAAEMLMPTSMFRAEISSEEPSIQLVERLATVFETSMEATALRYGRLAPSFVEVSLWKRRYSNLTPKWISGKRFSDIGSFRFRKPETEIEDGVARAYEVPSLLKKLVTDDAVYPPRRVLVECQGYGRGNSRVVLCLLRTSMHGGGR